MSKEQKLRRTRPSAGRFLLKRIFGPMISTGAAMLLLLVFLLTNAQDWHPEFAKGMLIGGGVAMIGGFFLMVKEIVQALVDYIVGDD